MSKHFQVVVPEQILSSLELVLFEQNELSAVDLLPINLEDFFKKFLSASLTSLAANSSKLWWQMDFHVGFCVFLLVLEPLPV